MHKLLLRLLAVCGLIQWQPYLCLTALGDMPLKQSGTHNQIEYRERAPKEESVGLMGILQRKSENGNIGYFISLPSKKVYQLSFNSVLKDSVEKAFNYASSNSARPKFIEVKGTVPKNSPETLKITSITTTETDPQGGFFTQIFMPIEKKEAFEAAVGTIEGIKLRSHVGDGTGGHIKDLVSLDFKTDYSLDYLKTILLDIHDPKLTKEDITLIIKGMRARKTYPFKPGQPPNFTPEFPPTIK